MMMNETAGLPDRVLAEMMEADAAYAAEAHESEIRKYAAQGLEYDGLSDTFTDELGHRYERDPERGGLRRVDRLVSFRAVDEDSEDTEDEK